MAATPQAKIERNGTAAAAEAVVLESNTQNVGRYRLANGIVLEFRHVAPRAIRQAQMRVQEPEVPVVHIEEKDRDEPNPNDPGYLMAYGEYIEEVAVAGQAVAFMLGVHPVEIPDGMHGPEAGEWIAELAAAGIEVREGPEPARRYDWLALYALASEEDLHIATLLAMQRCGLTEGEIDAAVRSFRGGTPRHADPESRTAEAERDGDPVQEASG